MLKLTFKEARKNFFDRAKVVKATEKGQRKSLAKIGGFIRTNSRRRIRKARRMKPEELTEKQMERWEANNYDRKKLPLKSSEPGESPRSRSGKLRKTIFFAYDELRKSVVVGPVKFAAQSDAPEDLEKGGQSEIAVYGRDPRAPQGRDPTEKQLKAFREKLAAGELTQRRRGRKRRFSFTIKKRPYMAPSLQEAKPKIPPEFKGIVR